MIRVRSAGTLGARFDMRAESETGDRDFGRNLELIKTYRAALNSWIASVRQRRHPAILHHVLQMRLDRQGGGAMKRGRQTGIEAFDQRRTRYRSLAAGARPIWFSRIRRWER